MNPPGKSFEEFIQSAPEGRYHGIERTYGAADVARLRGSVQIRHTLAERGANRLWELLQERDYVNSLGAMSGNQAMQQVRAGLEAIYLSGWQVAADANAAGAMYPDQSLYPANSGPELVRKINRTLQRADQIEHSEGGAGRDWFAPILADAEAGFGGPLERVRADEGHTSRPAPQACTSRTSSPPRRSAGTSAARSWCRPSTFIRHPERCAPRGRRPWGSRR